MKFSSSHDAIAGGSRPRWLALLPQTLRTRLDGRGGVHAVIANSGWLIADRIVRALVGVLVGAWVARYLGPAEYGSLAYVLAYVAMFYAFATMSADSIIVRDIVQKPEEAPEILGSALVARLALGAACWIGAVLCTAVVSRGDHKTVILSAIVSGVLLFQAADVFDLWFQSQSQSKRTVIAKLVGYLVTSGIKVALILQQAPLFAFAWALAFDAFAAAIAQFLAYRRYRTARPWRPLRRTAKAILSQAWPYMLSGFAIMAYIRVDQIMIREMLGPRELGIYAAVLPISQFWRRKVADEASYIRTLVLVFRTFFYAGAASALVTIAASGLIVRSLFGPQFADGAVILAVHSVSNIFCFLGIAHGLWLVNERRFAVRLHGTALAALTALSMNFVLLPRIGLVGAAYAAIVAQIVAAFLINLFLDRRSFRLQCDAILFRKA
jgi:PST family polysaccharide transporter